MGRKLKVLVAGDTAGQLNVVFAKVSAFNASKAGPFDLLFCVGRFFAAAGDDAPAGAAEADEPREVFELKPGVCCTIGPEEPHMICAAEDCELTMTYLGVVAPETKT